MARVRALAVSCLIIHHGFAGAAVHVSRVHGDPAAMQAPNPAADHHMRQVLAATKRLIRCFDLSLVINRWRRASRGSHPARLGGSDDMGHYVRCQVIFPAFGPGKSPANARVLGLLFTAGGVSWYAVCTDAKHSSVHIVEGRGGEQTIACTSKWRRPSLRNLIVWWNGPRMSRG